MKTLAVLTVLAALSDLLLGPLPDGYQMAVAWTPIAIGASAALSALSGSRDRASARDLSEAEWAFLQQQYAEREPLRAMGFSRLQSPLPERPDLGADFADPSNPLYREPAALGFGSGYSNQPPDMEQAMAEYQRSGPTPANRKADLEKKIRGAGWGVFKGEL